MKMNEVEKRKKVKWTPAMINDLRTCKTKALSLINGDNPPRKANGRKIGYIHGPDEDILG